MNFGFVRTPLVLTIVATLAASLPVAPPQTESDKVTVYVPYDVKYVPIEIPDELLNVEPLNSANPSTAGSIVLRKDDILKHVNDESGDNSVVKPVATIDQATNEKPSPVDAQFKDPFSNEDLVVVPLSALKIPDQQKSVAEPKEDLIAQASTQLLNKPDGLARTKRNSVFYHEGVEEPAAVEHLHKVVKRQTRRRPFYRPVIRFSRFSSNRRRYSGPSMVGYLNDRDRFPTLA